MDAMRLAELNREADDMRIAAICAFEEALDELEDSGIVEQRLLADYRIAKDGIVKSLEASILLDAHSDFFAKRMTSGQRRLVSDHYAYNDEPWYGSDYLDALFEMPAGDYVITDPCYLMKEGDWNRLERIEPSGLSAVGIPTSHMRSTLYGDWSCHVWQEGEEEPIGRFCADTGMVCVAKLDEVLAYNPDFEQWMAEHDWCVAVIRNFKGTCAFTVIEEEYFSRYRGEMVKDYSLFLKLDGHDTATGEHVLFNTKQTEF